MAGADAGKTTFGFAKKAAKKKTVAANGAEDDVAKKEYLTGMGSGGLELKDKKEKVVKSIPAIANTFEVGTGRQRKAAGHRAPSFLPNDAAIEEDAERFEVAARLTAGGGETAQGSGTVYGLTKMGPKDGDVKLEDDEKPPPPANESFIGKSLQEKELQAFREDVQDLPEQASLDDYESMPIEDFGAAMLRGMGWEEGKPVGRNSKGLVAAVEFVPRAGRLGLGAEPAPKPEVSDARRIKPGETRERADVMVLPEGPEGKSRNVKSLDEKLVKREDPGPREGKMMCVVEGRHRGLECRVLTLTKSEGRSERAQVELKTSGEVVTVRTSELADFGSGPADRAMGIGRGGGGGGDTGGKKRERTGGGGGDEKKEKRKREEPPPWLYPAIRVRIVSKSFQSGRLYLKKAVVVDVVSPRECTLELENGEVLSNVPQRALETALPKRGGRVAVLAGAHRGKRGKLLEKSGDAGSVQLNDDFSVHSLSLDAIAEYTGAIDEED